jgi:hypothetical protein
VDLVTAGGGEVRFARILVSPDEQERRIGNDDRKEFGKLVSRDLLRDLRDSFLASEQEMPAADLVIDSDLEDPETAARRMAAAFNLPVAPAML